MDNEDRCYQFFYSLEDYPDIVHLEKLTYPAYDMISDTIYMPYNIDQPFQEAWQIIFHELTHRQFFRFKGAGQVTNLDEQSYLAFTELLAEVGSSILCQQTGIIGDTKQHHIKYITWWKAKLQDNTLLKYVVLFAIGIIGELLQRDLYRIDIPQEIRVLFLGR